MIDFSLKPLDVFEIQNNSDFVFAGCDNYGDFVYKYHDLAFVVRDSNYSFYLIGDSDFDKEN